jgi:hypothetical protein
LPNKRVEGATREEEEEEVSMWVGERESGGGGGRKKPSLVGCENKSPLIQSTAMQR